MTISELAKIALDEGRIVKIRRKSWKFKADRVYLPCRIDVQVPFYADDLAADDWEEFKWLPGVVE